jgi:hypothetical protein
MNEKQLVKKRLENILCSCVTPIFVPIKAKDFLHKFQSCGRLNSVQFSFYALLITSIFTEVLAPHSQAEDFILFSVKPMRL